MNENCPFCSIINSKFDGIETRKDDVIYEDEDLIAFISTRGWNQKNIPVLIVPKKHTENLYDTADVILDKVNRLAKKIAIALKETIGCEGVSLRQNNEKAGNQSVMHYHLQVVPRYINDDFYVSYNKRRPTTDKERKKMADKLKKYFERDQNNG